MVQLTQQGGYAVGYGGSGRQECHSHHCVWDAEGVTYEGCHPHHHVGEHADPDDGVHKGGYVPPLPA